LLSQDISGVQYAMLVTVYNRQEIDFIFFLAMKQKIRSIR